MTAQNFMNVVRFKLKSDCVDKYFEVIAKTSFEGMTQRYIAKTGDYDYCFVGIWKSADAIAAQRPAMIAHLNDVRGFMEELSPELGVTDPVSGNIVSKVGYHDWQSILHGGIKPLFFNAKKLKSKRYLIGLLAYKQDFNQQLLFKTNIELRGIVPFYGFITIS